MKVNMWGAVMFFSFLLSMIFFITAEVFAILKINRKDCTVVRAFLWFEVLGFISVLKDHYRVYDRGSERLKDCEKRWWDIISRYVHDGILDPYDVCLAVRENDSESAMKRYIFISTLEKWTRLIGVVLYILSFVIIVWLSGFTSWLLGSLLIPIWNAYKLYYVYGIFRPVVKLKACSRVDTLNQ